MFVFVLDWWLVLQFFLSTGLPLLVGLVTTRMTSANVKALLLLGLSVLSSALTELASWNAAGRLEPYDLFSALMMAITSFVIGVGFHFGLYSRPNSSGVSIADKVADTGVTPRHRA